ncbi:PorP/SprF family type IX secretion system membrane protein [Pseudozobellia thermophila]|uniref:Type IX secretion system membrane protein, PorP/SprF family n=1 Tax=Pseudozobellia thermophila TaxID=192903 RepID=A0A1M6N360_9FLAO|nr:PorP/SprF family type IX secretion system membrane protein [Pseudozobellia thermophila]SHJ90161.1 type IX secretion system membrane protein, PorP/SprF family [Pseudozobellia thermophila]
MSYTSNTTNRFGLLFLFCALFGLQMSQGQEAPLTEINSKSTYHNQLFYNRFLINPTFSLVRENKSYINILHRNQYATFEDNDQNYFLGFSNRLNNNTALGISVYSQWSGVVQEFGFNANYATAVRLGEKNKLTFGTNITYYNEGLDRNRIVAVENDNKILESKKESKVAIQPGVTLSLGSFDFGLYATDLFKYNQTANTFLTTMSTKSVKASVQYSHNFMANRGIFAHARLMPLVQVGQNTDGSLDYVGSVVLDMPTFGWFQANYDDTYGLSTGLGFNLSKRMSIGYLLEKDLNQDDADLGWNHEVSLAYNFDDHGSQVNSLVDTSNDAQIDRIVRNYEEQILRLTAENEKATGKDRKSFKKQAQEAITAMDDPNSLAYENRLIIDEMILRQDSIDAARDAAFQARLESLVDVLKKEIRQSKQVDTDVEDEKEKTPRFNTALADNTTKTETRAPQAVPAKAANDAKPGFDADASDDQVASGAIDDEIRKSVDNFFNEREEAMRRQREQRVAQAQTKPVTAAGNDAAQLKEEVNLPIRVLNQSNIVGAKSGYFVIANVYSNKKYMNAFMETLKKQGLKAGQFYNKENGLYYVYLADYNFKEDAKNAYVTNLDGKYKDEKWIMQVDDHSAIVNNMYEEF